MTSQEHVAKFYRLIKINEHIMRINFIVLKYKSQDHKHSCKWFQESELNETKALLLPEIMEKLTSSKINCWASQKTSEIFTIAGTTVKLAYHFKDTATCIKTALTSTANHDENPGKDNFQSHAMYKMEVVVGIMKIDEMITGHISQLLSQQSSLTTEKTAEISHYFSKLATKTEKVELDNNENIDTEGDTEQSPKKMSEPQIILRKLVNEGLLKEKNRKVKKSRLTTKKRTAVVADPAEQDLPSTSSKFQKKDTQESEHDLHIPHVRDLGLIQLEEYFERNNGYLQEILNGKRECTRHADYWHSSKKRRALDYQLNLLFYSEDQAEHAVNLLKTLFATAEDQKLDYILRVLLPEFLIKVYMDLNNVDHNTAELKMKPSGCF